jgi:hypothetical protein
VCVWGLKLLQAGSAQGNQAIPHLPNFSTASHRLTPHLAPCSVRVAFFVMIGNRGWGRALRCVDQAKAVWKNTVVQNAMMLLNGSHANFRKRRAVGTRGGQLKVGRRGQVKICAVHGTRTARPLPAGVGAVAMYRMEAITRVACAAKPGGRLRSQSLCRRLRLAAGQQLLSPIWQAGTS